MRYAKMDDAIFHAILPALGEFADQYDLDAIAAECITQRHTENLDGQTVGDVWFELSVSDQEFWASVARHELPADTTRKDVR